MHRIVKYGLIVVQNNKFLINRKRGTKLFLMPGGKPELNESVEDCLIREIREEHRIAHPIHGHKKRHEALVTLFHTKPFHALAMFIGGLFILLPGPDEVGIAIFSSYKMNSKKFILLSLALNAASVWIVMLAGAKQFFGS